MVGFAFALLTLLGAGDAAAEVTLETLLAELVDRDALARWPRPVYVTKQWSSRDRRSQDPADATEAGWFANTDNCDGLGADLEWVTRGGRDECVLVDVEGPGALVRFWSGGKKPSGTLRFYVDGAEEPVLAGAMFELLSGAGAIPPPLAVKTAGEALNLYLPIPFARRLEITFDEGTPPAPPPQRWFNAECRIYAAGTAVRSLAVGELERARTTLDAFARRLADGEESAGAVTGGVLAPGERFVLDFPQATTGSRAIREIVLTLPADGEALAGGADPRVLLRPLIVEATFDGEACVWCPASEFFGCGPLAVPLQTWTRSVTIDDGAATLRARFTMPFRASASLAIANVGAAPVALDFRATGGAWEWDERSLHFHATWRSDERIATRPFRDWSFVTIECAGGSSGTSAAAAGGVYVGDTLTVMNPTEAWWGEGDEKVFVDGERFPSHFGTGSEDCYGYAWGATTLFHSPFLAQPRCDGPANLGFTTVTRTRALDAIPFTTSLQYDLEVWHWADCEMSYAVASYWYARPGATSDRAPDPRSAAAPLREPGLAGAIECERAAVVATSPQLELSRQANLAFPSGRWSCDAQLFVQAQQPGDFVELRLARGIDGPRELLLHTTRSFDYGVLRFTVNGVRAAGDVDTWSGTSDLGPIVDLGRHAPRDGELVLRVEVVGRHPQSRGTGCFFGLDAVELRR